MSGNRHIDNITELLIIVISPALVMLMVGSLCYFAINCFYAGSFDGRMYFATGLFVFAAVLISRISIEEGREYASMFAVPLSITTLLSLMKYTDADILFLLPMVAFIWWSTDKLTWDCTVVDHKKDASGEGLLQTIGMDTEGKEGEGNGDVGEQDIDLSATTSRAKTDQKSFWQRWVERRKRKHTPGVWVIYFGMAAIPVFGIGQTLLPPSQHGPSFLLLCVYVASALALLMATSFLQMRRYLNQRRLELSDGMAATWLSSGGMLILGLMLLCLFLPRPNTGYSLVDHISKIGSKDQRASRFAFGKQDAVNDEDIDGSGESDEQADRDSERGSQTSDEAEQGDRASDDAEQKGSQQSKRGKQSKGDDSRQKGNDSQDDSNQSSQDQSSQDQSQHNSDDQDSRQNESNQSDRSDSQEDRQSQQNQERQNRKQSDRSKRDSTERQDSESGEDDASKSGDNEATDDKESESSKSSNRFKFEPPQLPDVLSNFSLPSIPKLIYFVIIGAIVLFVFLRYGQQIAAAIAAFVRDFLEMLRRLFGGKPREREVEEEQEEVEPEVPVRPFSSYPNPFAMGTVDRFSPQQLVNYTFEALQAWAHERDCPRAEQQTPLEFASRLAIVNEQVGSSAKNLAKLYNQVAYAPGSVSKDAVQHLKALWSVLR